jgi:hypothetical protein
MGKVINSGEAAVPGNIFLLVKQVSPDVFVTRIKKGGVE